MIDYTTPSAHTVLMSTKTVVLYLWQLPQVLVSFFIMIFFHKRTGYSVSYLTVNKVSLGPDATTGFSLGPNIFVGDNVSEDMLKHEVGHSMQSLFLGPLYLLVVGLPSVITFLVYKFGNKTHSWYLAKYPEKWANRLGGAYEFNKNPKG